MQSKCLVIADDLTGGADSGAQFAKRGLSTLLISLKEDPHIDFTQYLDKDVLVINTESRGLSPEKAFHLVSGFLKGYEKGLFSVVYKKIDSTLRGNIGQEIDAILRGAKISLGFIAPSFPEQSRTLVGDIMMVGGIPLSLTEASKDAVSPVRESHVQKLLRSQSDHKIGKIDLIPVASSPAELKKAVDKERKKGRQILVLDAVLRRDLTHIAEVGFSLEEKPLFIGSAGLAEEVAKKLALPKPKQMSHPFGKQDKPISHMLIISGSASAVAHQQLNRIEQRKKISSFEVSKSLILEDEKKKEREAEGLSLAVGDALAKGHALLKSCSERIPPKEPSAVPIHLEITEMLGQIALSALEKSKMDLDKLILLIIGGDTARSVFHHLEFKGLEIIGEIMDGVIVSQLIGGNWSGLKVITKAGAFGKENTLEKIAEILETESSSCPDVSHSAAKEE